MLVGVLHTFASAGDVPTTVTFDFDSLDIRRGDLAISNYMSDVYGSQVATDGARAIAEADNDADIFIATSLQLLGRGDFIIEFRDVPIIAAQFEGHVIDATGGDDFRLRAFAGDEEVFLFTRNTGEESFVSDWLFFPQPIDRLIISDNGRRDVGIDDFVVQPVPEPGTLLLSAFACLWVGAYRFRRRLVDQPRPLTGGSNRWGRRQLQGTRNPPIQLGQLLFNPRPRLGFVQMRRAVEVEEPQEG